MRKILSALILASLLLPTVILAQAAPPPVTGCLMRHTLSGFTGFYCPILGTTCTFELPPACAGAPNNLCTCGACCFLDTIYTVTDWIFYIAFAIAIIFIIMGAFTIITAGGSPEKVQTGRNYIVYAVIGLLIGLAAKAIPGISRAILGV